MNRLLGSLIASGLALGTASAALAQQQPSPPADNLKRMQDFNTTGTPLQVQEVPQGGPKADRMKKNLERIKLPQGFKIGLYAVVPDARHMAVGRNAGALFVGTRKTNAWVATDRDKDRVADDVRVFAAGIGFRVPNGPCMTPDGVLYLAEHNRVLAFGAAEFFYEGGPDVAVSEIVPQGQLIPPEEESFNHGARVCRIGPDGKLYITLGQRYNVTPPDKVEKYAQLGIGGIIRMDLDGKNREVVARGIRNSVGFDFNPANGQLWFTDNQVDGMGDDIPPGELNRITQPGQHFGFPWYGGGKVRTKEFSSSEPPANTVFPELETVAHAADLGMIFYTGRMFPEKYRGGIFSAQHGSWNRTTPMGARVMFTSLKPDGSVDKMEPFAEGWLLDTGEYTGRPVDIAQLPDGSLLVSDDLVGAVYRIWYEG
jgi:glucose/arabinose dehydrogenase